jgi:hypothetical protein
MPKATVDVDSDLGGTENDVRARPTPFDDPPIDPVTQASSVKGSPNLKLGARVAATI